MLDSVTWLQSSEAKGWQKLGPGRSETSGIHQTSKTKLHAPKGWASRFSEVTGESSGADIRHIPQISSACVTVCDSCSQGYLLAALTARVQKAGLQAHVGLCRAKRLSPLLPSVLRRWTQKRFRAPTRTMCCAAKRLLGFGLYN